MLDVLALSNSSMVERREADVWTGDGCSKRPDPLFSRVSEDLRAKRVELPERWRSRIIRNSYNRRLRLLKEV